METALTFPKSVFSTVTDARGVGTVGNDRAAADRDGSAVGAASTADTRCAVCGGSRDRAAGNRDRSAVCCGAGAGICAGADACAASDGSRGHGAAGNAYVTAAGVCAAADSRAAVSREIAVSILRADSARPGINGSALNGHGEVGSAIAAANASAKCAPGLNICAGLDRHRTGCAAVLTAADARAVIAARV